MKTFKHSRFDDAKEYAKKNSHLSLNDLEFRFSIGRNSSSMLMDQLEEAGIVEPFQGNSQRKVLTDNKEENGK